MATAIAWGAPKLYELPSGERVWGREFELLPSGSMAGAAQILHGVIGPEVTMINDIRGSIATDAKVLFCGLKTTTTAELIPYQTALSEGMRVAPSA
jgi:hypothetical protein